MSARKVTLDLEQRVAPDPAKPIGYMNVYVLVRAQNTVEWPIGHMFFKKQIDDLLGDRPELIINIK